MSNCVMCGEVIPEGRQVCPKCEAENERRVMANDIKWACDEFVKRLMRSARKNEYNANYALVMALKYLVETYTGEG